MARFGQATNVVLVIAAIAAIGAVGCSNRPARVKPPKIRPDKAAADALAEYDSDGDGFLAGEELQQCPGIHQKLSAYDADGDSKVSADEIAQRLSDWQDSGVGLISFECTVKLKGRPLPGAEVEITPESFLGEAIKPATGTTGPTGMAILAIAPELLPEDQQDLHGVHIGLYRVAITHPTVKLPERFNVKTSLGCEVSPRGDMKPVEFEVDRR